MIILNKKRRPDPLAITSGEYQFNDKQDYQKQINSIMKNFNFSKVAASMVKLNWCWASSCYYDHVSAYDYYIPNEDELRVVALRLLRDIADDLHIGHYTGTGGFETM